MKKSLQKSTQPSISIGTRNEGSLHASVKQWYAHKGDVLEVKVDGSIIDLQRGKLLIEIQTRNFSAIRDKLKRLVQKHKLMLVYPIPQIKWITRLDKDGITVISRRKSPKTGDVTDLFDELLRIPTLINEPNFWLEVLLIESEEIRCMDGKGSWRRQGVSIQDRKLIRVIKKYRFKHKDDFLHLLPPDIPQPFTNKSLAKAMKLSVYKIRRLTYTLRKMGLLDMSGKQGNQIEYKIVASSGKTKPSPANSK